MTYLTKGSGNYFYISFTERGLRSAVSMDVYEILRYVPVFSSTVRDKKVLIPKEILV